MNTIRLKAPLPIVLLFLAMLSSSGGTTLAQGNSKGGGKPKDPPPFMVVDLGEYQSQAWHLTEPDEYGTVLVGGMTWVDGRPEPIFWDVTVDGLFVPSYPGLPPNATEASITDMNELGTITLTTQGAGAGWYRTPGGGYQQLPFSSGWGQAYGLNNFADIAGVVGTVDWTYGALWTLDGDQYLPPLQFDFFYPKDIADNGTMIGRAFNVEADRLEAARAWLDPNGELQVQLLGVLPGTNHSEAYAMSSNGNWVVGRSGSAAFVWSDATGMIPLGTLGGADSRALDVNDFGQVVGWSNPKKGWFTQTAIIWQDGVMADLNEIARTDHRPHLVYATSINNAGHIGGFTRTSRSISDQHGYILIPTSP
jgi:probable HAF family extracellular repeat protein